MTDNVHKLYAHKCSVCGRAVKPTLGTDGLDKFIADEMPEPEAVFCSDECFDNFGDFIK